MRIGIDARFLGPEGTGLGRYIQELILHLEKIDTDNEYVIFLRKSNFDLYNPSNARFKKVLADIKWYTLEEQLKLPGIIEKENLDLMHFGHFNVPVRYKGRYVVTVHDIIKSEFRGKEATTRSSLVYWLKYLGYEYVLKRAVQKAEMVIVPSKAVKEKLKKKFGEGKVETIHEGYDEKIGERIEGEEEVLKKYGIEGKYVLNVGNSYPYKNLDRLIEAVKKIDGIKLINPCARSVFYDKLREKIEREGLQGKVVLPGFVPDRQLGVLYRNAFLYVLPSLSEGFGIPALEAMAAGVPVLAAETTSLPEVCGEGAMYFDPYDVDDLANKIKKIKEDEGLRVEMVQKGKENISRFSWTKMAEETKKVYERVSSSEK